MPTRSLRNPTAMWYSRYERIDRKARQALKSYPDRVPASSAERPARTKKFQQINTAYYTLSDPARCRDYDHARSHHSFSEGAESSALSPGEEVPPPGEGGFSQLAFGFGARTPAEQEKAPDEQFGSVFEEMLKDEGLAEGQDARPTGKFWSLIGGVSGDAMGFIIANVPGAIAGAVAGNRLGAVRDAKGMSIYSVFEQLPQAEKTKLLSELAAKVFVHAVGGS